MSEFENELACMDVSIMSNITRSIYISITMFGLFYYVLAVNLDGPIFNVS